ncbi:MAG: hypothetical protein H7A22_02285 [Spirochaetales bacterium]|nr:hypothetical protein [Spirochaetales bacterium]
MNAIDPGLSPTDLLRLKRREHAILRSSARVIDLDESSFQITDVLPSDFGRGHLPNAHVHEILVAQSGASRFFCKGEDAYVPVDSRNGPDFRSFRSFVDTLFDEGEGTTPFREFFFEEEPEIAPVRFLRASVPDPELLRGIADETAADSIKDPELRKLFLYYLSRKERIVRIGDREFENAFSHHGRDVVTEFLASNLGHLLEVPVPRNFLGLRTLITGRKQKSRELASHLRIRYVVSRALSTATLPPPLTSVLARIYREDLHDPDSARQFGVSQGEANPLRLEHSSWHGRDCTIDSADAACVLQTRFRRHADLIRSDVLDRLLFAGMDRKLDEYLVPFGQDGPIFTVDYGEVLFPELQFEVGDRHYEQRLEQHLRQVSEYVIVVHSLPAVSAYRLYALRTLALFILIAPGFFEQIINNIPPIFFRYHYEERRRSCLPETLIDCIQRVQATVAASLGAPGSGPTLQSINALFS